MNRNELDFIVSKVLHLSLKILAFLSLHTIDINVKQENFHSTLPLMELPKSINKLHMMGISKKLNTLRFISKSSITLHMMRVNQ